MEPGRFTKALHQQATADSDLIRHVYAEASNYQLPPVKTLKVYKVFQTKKTRPGEIFPLFINANVPVPLETWVPAEMNSKGKSLGFAERPGWHVGTSIETHLDLSSGTRVWAECEIPADIDWQPVADASPSRDLKGQPPIGGYYVYLYNGKPWIIAGAIKVIRVIPQEDAGEDTSNFTGRTKRKSTPISNTYKTSLDTAI